MTLQALARFQHHLDMVAVRPVELGAIEQLRHAEQRVQRRLDFRSISDKESYLFRRGVNSGPTLEKREFYPADRTQLEAS